MAIRTKRDPTLLRQTYSKSLRQRQIQQVQPQIQEQIETRQLTKEEIAKELQNLRKNNEIEWETYFIELAKLYENNNKYGVYYKAKDGIYGQLWEVKNEADYKEFVRRNLKDKGYIKVNASKVIDIYKKRQADYRKIRETIQKDRIKESKARVERALKDIYENNIYNITYLKTAQENKALSEAIKQNNEQIKKDGLKAIEEATKLANKPLTKFEQKYKKGIDISKEIGLNKPFNVPIETAVRYQDFIYKKETKDINEQLKNIEQQKKALQSTINNIIITKISKDQARKQLDNLKKIESNLKDVKDGFIKEFKPTTTPKGFRELLAKTYKTTGLDTTSKYYTLTKKGQDRYLKDLLFNQSFKRIKEILTEKKRIKDSTTRIRLNTIKDRWKRLTDPTLEKLLIKEVKKIIDKELPIVSKSVKGIKKLSEFDLKKLINKKLPDIVDKKLLSVALKLEKTESELLKDAPKVKPKFNNIKELFTKDNKNKPSIEKTKAKIKEYFTKDYNKPDIKETSAKTLATVQLAGLGASRVGLGAVSFALRPMKTTKETLKALTQPVKLIKSELHRFSINPVGVATEYLTAGKLFNLASTTLKRSPVGLAVEKELFILKQPKELRKYVRSILESSIIQSKLNPYKIKNIKISDFLKVKALNKIEAKALKKTLEQTDSVIFGSFASKILSGGKTKLPKDVDLATKNIKDFQIKFIKNLPKIEQKKYKISKESITRRKTNEKILDIKPFKRLRPEQSLITRKGYLPVYGYVKVLKAPKNSPLYSFISKKQTKGYLELPTSKSVKIGKLKLIGFGEQTLRKGLGTLEVLLQKNIKRAKDPQGFIEGLQIQISELKNKKIKSKILKSINNRKIKKLQNTIKLLTSKKFLKILNSKAKGILKDYPLVKNIPINKLKKVKLRPTITKEIKLKIISSKNTEYFKKQTKFKKKKPITTQEEIKLKIISSNNKLYFKSRLKPSRLKPSKLKPSRLKPSKLKPSRLKPSKLKPSRLKPSRLKPSRLKPSRLKPSRLKPSRLKPSNLKPSNLKPSNLKPSNLKPSNLKSSNLKPSRLKPSRLKPSRLKPSRLIKLPKSQITKIEPSEEKKRKITKKAFLFGKKKGKFIYLPDLTAVLKGERAKGKERLRLIDPRKVFSGFEVRKLIK